MTAPSPHPPTARFAVTWDYRCPFARNAHEHVVKALEDGVDWDVRFVPFSLAQAHVSDDETDIWERPGDDSGLLALQAGVVVRDGFPDRFGPIHLGLFALRHDEGKRLQDETEIRGVLEANGVDADAVFAEVATGSALRRVRDEHTAAADGHEVWGVPTFLLGDAAVFVRLMERPGDDGDYAQRSIQRILDLLVDAPDLNEFKHTSLKR